MSLIGMSAHDAGRMACGYFAEKNDCTVRAYATACNLTYMQAHAELFVAGRKMRRGFRFLQWANTKGWQSFPRPRMEVENYIKYVAHSGSWIIMVRGHVFAIVDSTIHDINPATNLKRHVLGAWKIK